MTKLRVLFARNLYRPVDFGGNRYPLEMTRRLALRGHRVHVVTGAFSGSIPGPAGLTVQRYPVSRRTPLATFATNALFSRVATELALRRLRPQAVLVGSYDVGFGYYALPSLATRPASAYIYHSSFYSDAVEHLRTRPWPFRVAHGPLSSFMRSVQRAVLRGPQLVVAVSPFSAHEVARDRTDAGVRVIPTGVDEHLFHPGDRAAARSALGLEPNALVLVTVGRLVPVKRYERAVEAVSALVKHSTRNVTLLVVGDGPEIGRLRRLAGRLGIAPVVRFEGYRDGEELLVRLRASDLQLCTSEFENWSLALLEGLACGIPAIGTPFGGTPELLRLVDDALVLPSGDIDDLVSRILLLAEDPRRLQALGSKGRELVVARFTWERVVDQLEDVLQELAARPSATSTRSFAN